MKKFVALSFAIPVAIGLAACSSEEATTPIEENSVEAAADSTMEQADTAAAGVENAIAEAEANADDTAKSIEQSSENAAAGVIEAAGERAQDEIER